MEFSDCRFDYDSRGYRMTLLRATHIPTGIIIDCAPDNPLTREEAYNQLCLKVAEHETIKTEDSPWPLRQRRIRDDDL